MAGPFDDLIPQKPAANPFADLVPKKPPQKSSTIGAFARGAERGALPAAGGIAGAGAGAEAGALAGAAIPGLGETGIGEAGGAVIGGLVGGFGGGAAIQKAQDYVGSKVSDVLKRAFGQDSATQAADTSQHPYASFAGELAPNLAAFSPLGAERAAENAPRLVKAAMHPITQRAVPAATLGGIEAGEEYADKGNIDPGKVAIAAGVGALANKPTRIGRALQGPGERAAQAVAKAFGVETHGTTADGAAAEKGAAAGPIKDWPDRPPPAKGDAAFKAGRDLDETLHKVTTNNQADVSDARQYIESLPKEHQSPEFQERVYHEIEARSVDPRAPLSPDVQKFVEDTGFKDWYEKQKPLYDWIKAHKSGEELLPEDEEPGDTSSGYVHRIAQDKGSRYDSTDPGNREVLAPGGRTLPRKAESENARKFFVLDDGKGVRTFVPPGKGGDLTPGQSHVGSDGKPYSVRYATTQEVEQNTPVRYHKNAVVNTVENVLKLQRVKRSLETLDAVRQEGEASGLIHSGKNAPRDFVYPNIPQMRDLKMHPALAQSLNDFYGTVADRPALEALDAANRFLTRSIFFNPVPHLQNVGAFWAVARGSDWARPGAYGQLVKTGAQAIKEVVTQGPLVKQMLREGSALQYPRTANQNFYKLMISRMGKDIEGDPQTWSDVARNFGFSTPKDLVKQIYRTSQKAMWMGSDMMMVQRVLELQQKGMKLPEAIQEAERWIPNYRVPSQVWNGPGGRAVSQMLQSPSGIMFGRYKYDQVKLIANLAHDLAKGSAAQRKEALAKAVVLVGMATAAYPVADYALKKVLGRDDVRMRRSGPLAIPDAIMQFGEGQKDWAEMLSSVITPAPVTEALMEAHNNKDFFGRDIIDKRSTPLGQAAQGGEFTLGLAAPVGEAEEAMKPGGAAKVALRNAGIQTVQKPTPPRIERRLRRAAGRRESNDPVEQALRNAIGQ